ncbi:MAG TPA: M20/M25/M40 family metallo-hydrolase, partial [Methanocorpusculum sp.]|nr:M20/M25/M40 family metallo-hydrolase [Methanocorpusculum sp.]
MDVVKLCSEMVKIKTENPPGDTRDCAEFVGDYLESIGIPVSYTYGPDGRTNVYSRDQTGDLLLLGHIDVVPAIPDGWDHPPYSGFVDETYVHGRGSADMKGGCAALMSALSAVQDKGLDVPVSVALVCDEEGGGRYGTRQLLAEKIIKPCDCLIAEPT